jgi:hypothetical protein
METVDGRAGVVSVERALRPDCPACRQLSAWAAATAVGHVPRSVFLLLGSLVGLPLLVIDPLAGVLVPLARGCVQSVPLAAEFIGIPVLLVLVTRGRAPPGAARADRERGAETADDVGLLSAMSAMTDAISETTQGRYLETPIVINSSDLAVGPLCPELRGCRPVGFGGALGHLLHPS